MMFQIASIVGAIFGWFTERSDRANIRSAWLSFPMGVLLLGLQLSHFSFAMQIFATLAGLSLGYGVGFLIRRSQRVV